MIHFKALCVLLKVEITGFLLPPAPIFVICFKQADGTDSIYRKTATGAIHLKV